MLFDGLNSFFISSFPNDFLIPVITPPPPPPRYKPTPNQTLMKLYNRDFTVYENVRFYFRDSPAVTSNR